MEGHMERITNHIFYFPGSVNMVYTYINETGVLIDGGLDEGRMKKVVREITQAELPLTHLIVTHAHADHFGGVHWLQKNHSIITYAPPIEASIMESPILEPIYLFGGTNPLPELRNKFLEAKPIKIDVLLHSDQLSLNEIDFSLHPIPGHSYGQLAVGINKQVLFAADGYFSSEVLDKHGVPFLIDAKETIKSLEYLKTLKEYQFFLPGHGQVEQDIQQTIQYNITRHEEILSAIGTFVLEYNKVSLEEVMTFILSKYNLESTNLGQWLLYRTAIQSYLRALIEDSKIIYFLEDNRLLFKS